MRSGAAAVQAATAGSAGTVVRELSNLAAAVEIDEEEIALDEGAAGLFDDA